VAVFRPFGFGTELSQQGTYVYEVSPTGSVQELPAKISDSNAGLAGIAAAGPDSVWIPGSHHVRLLGGAGVEKEVAVGRAEIGSVATDRHGGLWVAAGPHVFHVSPSGEVSRLRVGPLEPASRATVSRLVEDHGGNLWLTVLRGGESLTSEVIERSQGGWSRTFRIDRRFFGTEEIGISGGGP
jgi:ligand-binding sensor domain-containing protein